MKTVRWNSKAREFVRSLDIDTKREIGTLLMMLQQSVVLQAPLSKPMKIIHTDAHELRVKDAKGIYRVIYVLKVKGKILIPHAFTKKMQKTPIKEIATSRSRLQELLNEEN